MSVAILWFRRDFRLSDNEALVAACKDSRQLLPLYIHDPDAEGAWAPGAASRWWLHHTLAALDERLQKFGSKLVIRHGNTIEVLRALARRIGANTVFCNRLYEPAHRALESELKKRLDEEGVNLRCFGGHLIFEPDALYNSSGEPYRVFTPFWKAALRLPETGSPLPPPRHLPPIPPGYDSPTISKLKLLPRMRWDKGLAERWQPGEAGAQKRSQNFVEIDLVRYTSTRDTPGSDGTSRLSPHLHFGEITPRQIIGVVRDHVRGWTEAASGFHRQLIWREFAHYLLHHFPNTVDHPMDSRFTHFPWRANADACLHAWQHGSTGIPLIDAGMRELWSTGWMHNRVRMITASFLTKNLLIPWQQGAKWFWDTLVDADLANNSLGWQWVAGCGADAAPYFRIFNPVLQGEKFDAQGRYVRQWLPTLARLPDRWLHKPWQAPPALLEAAGIKLGSDYPFPIVDLAASRQESLSAYNMIKRIKRVSTT